MSNQIKISVDGKSIQIAADQRPTHLFETNSNVVVCRINGQLSDLWSELKEGDVYEGQIEFSTSGNASLVINEKEIFVYKKNTANSLHLDKVKVQIFKAEKKLEGKVIEVISRFKTEFVGKVQIGKKTIFVVPDSNKIPVDFYIKGGLKAEDGQKVVVDFVKWNDSKSPQGKIVKILGNSGDNNTEMNSIMAEYGLPVEFPQEVINESAIVPEIITEKEISKRSVVETAEDDLPANLKSSGITSEIDYLKRLKLRSQIIANHAAHGGLHVDEIAIAKFKSAEDSRLEKYYGKLIILYNKTIKEPANKIDRTPAEKEAVMQAKMELAYLYSIYGYKNLYSLAHDLSEVQRVQKSNDEIKHLSENLDSLKET